MSIATDAYRTAGKTQRRDALIVEHLPFVRHVLSRLVATLPPNVDADNLESAGILGLVEAAQQFDAQRGVPFRSFAYPRVRGAIIDELRRNCPLPQRVLQEVAQVRAACESLEPPATPERIAQTTGLSHAQVERCLEAMRMTRTQSCTDAILAMADEDDPRQSSPDCIVETAESRSILADCVEQLPEQERLVLTLYYLEDLRLKEIGLAVGLSESRVSRILAKAEHRLAELFRVRTQ